MSWRVTPKGRPQDYPRTMLRLTDFFTKYQPSTEERIAYIDFLINVVKADVIGSAIVCLAYDEFTNEDDANPFPFDVYLDCAGEKEIVVSKHNLLILPSEEEKLFDAVQDIRTAGFILLSFICH